MTDLLREELQRLGDQARPVAVPAETWRRGRRARLRDRVFTAGAAVAVLAVVAGTAWAVIDGGRHRLPTDSRAEPGVPDRVWAVPYRVLATMEADLGVGLTATAYTTELGDVITVSAVDGSYHRLLLERLTDEDWRLTKGMMSDGAWAALSPDGRMLAYAWETPSEGSPVPAGISVIDLVEGREMAVADVRGGAGISVQDLTWSSDGHWLAWSGLVTRSWTGSSRSYGKGAFGRIDVLTGRSDSASAAQGSWQGTAIDDNGTVLLINATDRLQPPRWAVPTRIAHSGSASRSQVFAVSPDGRLVLTSAATPSRTLEIGRRTDAGSFAVDVPVTAFPEGATVRPIGWIDETHAVVELGRAEGYDGGGWNTIQRPVAVVDTRDLTMRVVGQIQARYDNAPSIVNLTMATALMSADHPTVSRPEPRWPWSAERKALVWGLVIGLPVMALVAWRRFRRRPLPPRRTAGTS